MLNYQKPIVVDAPQRSEKWFKARLGIVTGSNVKYAISYSKPKPADVVLATSIYNENGFSFEEIEWLKELSITEFCIRVGVELLPSAKQVAYRQKLVSERLTGLRSDEDGYVSSAMKWGVISEINARSRYQLEKRIKVEDAPLLLHPTLKCGVSSDGHAIEIDTGEIGCIEIKCLETWNHLYKIIKYQEVPEDFTDQIHMEMWINGFSWCDFIGYDSRLKEGLKIYIERVYWNEDYHRLVFLPALTRFLEKCDKDERFFRMKIRQDNEVKK